VNRLSTPEGPPTTTVLSANWKWAGSTELGRSSVPDRSAFRPISVPGTVAAGLRDQGLWKPGSSIRFDSADHWFTCNFEAEPPRSDEQITLEVGGIATLSQVWLNGELLIESSSMFARHSITVTSLINSSNEIVVVCRALTAAAQQVRTKKPRQRWKTRVVAEPQLRWFRTTLFGRAPGFASQPEPVGPWRPIVLRREQRVSVESWCRRTEIEKNQGVFSGRLKLRALDHRAPPIAGSVLIGSHSSQLEWKASDGIWEGECSVQIPSVGRWWPHTHGQPTVYPVRVQITLGDGTVLLWEDAPVGFRTIGLHVSKPGNAFELCLNETQIFCRGVVWTPLDVVSLQSEPHRVRERLILLRNAGMNLIRVPGTMFYENDLFHELCDDLGLMVWQDMMFANMDYPFEDESFAALVHSEMDAELSRLTRHPSTAVLCGNSEIEQQAAMMGLEPSAGRGQFFAEELPQLVASHCGRIPYIESAPCGGDFPFRTRAGVTSYFGVGAYLRPIDDARRAEVPFASECLAFSNVPEPEAVSEIATRMPGGLSPTHELWKRGVPRDPGAGWDFEDVRDHYLKTLFGVDAITLRYTDSARYLDLSRVVTGELMSAVFSEWRRPASPCSGGVILWAADISEGAGWGVLDQDNVPKAPYWFLKRLLAPQAIWMTDEGLNGVDIHVANDLPETVSLLLRVAAYKNGEQKIASCTVPVILSGHTSSTFGMEQLLGRFIDASYAYRFGPPQQDVIVVSLYGSEHQSPLSQAFYFPVKYPIERRPLCELGITATVEINTDGTLEISLTAQRLAWAVRAWVPGFLPDDAYFNLEPQIARNVRFTPIHDLLRPRNIDVTAANAEGRINIAVPQPA
jgi:beta-mannosidase